MSPDRTSYGDRRGKMNKTKQNKKKPSKKLSGKAKVFYTIYSLFLSIVITVTMISLALSFTAFRSGYILKVSEKYGIPDATRKAIAEQIGTELQNSGVSDEFLSSLVPDNVGEQLKANLEAVYGKEEANNSYEEEYREYVTEKFWQELERQNGSPVSRNDKESNAIVSQLTDTVLKIYEDNTTLPFDAEQVIAPYIKQFKNIVRIYAVVLVAVSAIMIATMKKKYIAVAFGGSAILFGGLFAGLEISGVIKNIAMQSEPDILLIKALNGELGKALLICAILCAAVWIACSVISYLAEKNGRMQEKRARAAGQAGSAGY